MKRSRGLMFIDTMLAIAILGAAAGLLTMTVGQTMRASRLIDDRRAALHAAEETLLCLQTRQTPAHSEAKIELIDLPDAAPQGWRWVQVMARHRSGNAQLVGLARRAS